MPQAFVAWTVAALLQGIDEGGQQFFSIPQEYDIKKWSERFGVGRQNGTSTEHDWILITPFMTPEGNALLFQEIQQNRSIKFPWRSRSGELPMEVALVISNHPDLEPLCGDFGGRFVHVPVTPATKRDAEARILDLLEEQGIELAVLAKYMQVLSGDFLKRFPQVINIHHSFLPAFKGAQPYHRAWDRGVKLIGATAHYVTEQLDDGPIIEQATLPVSHRDEVEDLIRKGRDTERLALARARTLI